MGWLAFAGDDGVVHGLAGDLVVIRVLTAAEIPRGQAANLVQDIDQHGGSVNFQALTANRMVEQRFGEHLRRLHEGVLVRQRNCPASGIVDGDELNPLGPHHRAKAAAPEAAQLAVRVFYGDVGNRHHVFAGRPESYNADILAPACVQSVEDGKIPLANRLGLYTDEAAILADAQAIPGVAFGLPFDDQGMDAHARKKARDRAAGVGFLDAAGQRTFGTGRAAARIGCCGARQQAWREHKLVAWAKRMTGWRNLSGDNR